MAYRVTYSGHRLIFGEGGNRREALRSLLYDPYMPDDANFTVMQEKVQDGAHHLTVSVRTNIAEIYHNMTLLQAVREFLYHYHIPSAEFDLTKLSVDEVSDVEPEVIERGVECVEAAE